MSSWLRNTLYQKWGHATVGNPDINDHWQEEVSVISIGQKVKIISEILKKQSKKLCALTTMQNITEFFIYIFISELFKSGL